jgi:tRNA dimethylallyltransferase
LKNAKKTLIVVAGPTAVGKTAASIALARHFSTEIISADSRQIYKELTIGTAKPSEFELSLVRHHFINSHLIEQDYDAAQYGRDALALIEVKFKEFDQLILCGGSGLYIKAVCEGFDDIPEVPAEIREDLIEQFVTHGTAWLQDKMKILDPDYFSVIDNQNPHRLMRALEVKIGTGKSISEFRKNKKLEHDFKITKIGLELPREILYKRIDERMDQMIASGLFDEAKSLYQYKNHNALQTVGYQEIFDFMDGKFDMDETIRLLKRNSRRYAKRQMTWFKRDPEIKWLEPGRLNEILDLISNDEE